LSDLEDRFSKKDLFHIAYLQDTITYARWVECH